jgi:hypothetical protein
LSEGRSEFLANSVGTQLAEPSVMDRTARILASLALVVATSAILAACGGADDTNSLLRGGAPSNPTQPNGSGEPGTDPTSPGQNTEQSTSPTSPPQNGGGTDAGGGTSDSGSATKTTAFTGAPAYVATLGVSARKESHNFAGNTPTTNPAKQACAGCHSGFVMGGTIFKDVAGTIPAPSVEVRIRDANGNALSTYTDSDGNFWLRKPAGSAFNYPALVGARDATKTSAMTATIANGNCSAAGCHLAGATGPIHIP